MRKIHVKIVLDVTLNADEDTDEADFILTEWMDSATVEIESTDTSADVEDVIVENYEVTDSR
jgi:hypothetical protein